MASIRAGHQPVLLVVDVQVGVMADAWNAPRVIANVALAVERARSRRVPVLWVHHTSNELPSGSAPWQWVPELVPAPGEPVVEAGRVRRQLHRQTLSIGLALEQPDMRDEHDLIATADRRLYVAKREGRNRVVAVDPPSR